MNQRQYDLLIVGGYGHVGLPLGLVFAEAGLQVGLYDVDKTKEARIAAGELPFREEGAEPLLQRHLGRSLHLESDAAAVARADTVLITIGTPIDEYLNPNLRPILGLANELIPHLRAGHHIVLRSTVYPGTTERLDQYFRERGLSVNLAYCPERIVQGHAIRELKRLPQVVSGVTPEATRRSKALFARLGVETLEVTPPEAEMTKLFANAWRYIQFATANQFYIMAGEGGADFERVRYAMTYGYRRAQDFPGAGFAAGPCLLKDTMQLSAFARNNFLLGHAAMLINEGLPNHIVTGLRKDLDLAKHTVGILGMSFKADSDDIRDALSYKLGKLLRFHGAKVLYSDEFAQDPTFISKEELVRRSDVVILGVPHSGYRDLVIPPHVRVIDVWGFFGKPQPRRSPGRSIDWWKPSVGEREKRRVAEVLDSNYINEGEATAELERKVAEICGVPFAVATTSGTAAIFLGLAAAGVEPGDEVIVPDLTFIATANAVRLAGATPVLVDVRREDFNVDPAGIEAAVTPRTRAIVPVHVSGRPAAMFDVLRIARSHDLAVVEDAAEALGSKLRGRALGSWGDAGCFSFSPNKTITTGQGGMVVTGDEAIYRRLVELKDHGRPTRGTGGADEHRSLGFNFKLTNLQAAVGLAQLEDFPSRLEHQRELYRAYAKRMGRLPGLHIPGFDIAGGACPQWVDALVENRDGLHDFLEANHVGTRKYWHPIHTQRPYAQDGAAFPVASRVSREALWLPSALHLTAADVDEVCRLVEAWVAKESKQ